MAGINEKKWLENYRALHRYVEERRRLPQKTVVEGRGMLNWWKYNKKRRKLGALTEEQIRMLDELKAMCSTEHTGGRRKKQPVPQASEATLDLGMD